jgi:hypothetical protein
MLSSNGDDGNDSGVILSVAAFQAERRISRLTGPERQPNCTTTR